MGNADWIDQVQKVGDFTYKDPTTKRLKISRWVEKDQTIPNTDNRLSEGQISEDVMPTNLYEKTMFNWNHNSTKVDEYRDAEVFNVKAEKFPGQADRDSKNY